MGRSVSYPTGAIVAYATPSFAEDEVGADEDELSYDYFNFDDLLDDARAVAMAAWPSFYEVDKWLGREDHAIAENRWAYFGVSEYAGVVAYWIVAKDQDDDGRQGLAEQWVQSAYKKLRKTFGTMRRIGWFSDGTALYQRNAT